MGGWKGRGKTDIWISRKGLSWWPSVLKPTPPVPPKTNTYINYQTPSTHRTNTRSNMHLRSRTHARAQTHALALHKKYSRFSSHIQTHMKECSHSSPSPFPSSVFPHRQEHTQAHRQPHRQEHIQAHRHTDTDIDTHLEMRNLETNFRAV
jgi:hypothetical protein